MKTIKQILNRRPQGWRQDKTRERYPILPWSDYRRIFWKESPPIIPKFKQFETYYYWCLANGFMPYGGESGRAMTDIYSIAEAQIKAEVKALCKEFDAWLDKHVEP